MGGILVRDLRLPRSAEFSKGVLARITDVDIYLEANS
jgi:hypothetical protein